MPSSFIPNPNQDAVKLASTSRHDTTVYADDPELLLTLVPGRYLVTGQFIFEGASATPGAKALMAFSGTSTVLGGSFWGMDANPTFASGRFGSPTSSPNPDSGGAGIWTANRAAIIAQPAYFYHNTIINVTVGGVLSGQWAQVVSSADLMWLLIGSYISARKL